MIVLFFTLLAALPLLAQDYVWPIQASASLSATFCEYRDGHLHAGIDVKTWGEMDVPCQAIADGYIEKVIVNYGGYGRALFLQLDDGRRAVYAHLASFSPDIERQVREAQARKEGYRVRLTFEPDEMRVRKRQVIARTGTSGTEFPHLHFEIREGDEVINPLQFYPQVKDDRPPEISELLLIPRDSRSRINGSLLPQAIDPEQDQEIILTGPTVLAVNAHDRANGTYNRYAPYQLATEINGQPFYEIRFHRTDLEFIDNLQAVYLPGRGRDRWYFTTLYVSDVTTSSPFSVTGVSGILDLDLGTHDLKITASDFKGNFSSVQVPLEVVPSEAWELITGPRTLQVIRSHATDDYREVRFKTHGGQSRYPKLTEYRLGMTLWELDAALESEGLIVTSDGGRPVSVVPPQQLDLPRIEVHWQATRFGWVLVFEAENDVIYPISYRMPQNSGIHLGTLITRSPTVAESEPLSLASRGSAESVLLDFPGHPSLSIPLDPLNPLTSFRRREFTSPDSLISAWVQAENGGVQFIRMDTTRLETPLGERTAFSLEVLSDDSAAFVGEARFRVPANMSRPGIYHPGKRGRWRQLPVQQVNDELVVDLQRGGRLVLLEDLTPPRIEARDVKSSVRPGGSLVYRIDEDFGRIGDPDTAIVTTFNSARLYSDWNALRREVTIRIPWDTPQGQYPVQLQVADAAGNRNRVTTTVLVR